MLARCGRCGATIEVLGGAGRFQCPACGTTNQVGGAAAAPPPAASPPPTPATPPAPDIPSPRAECGECGFSFIVGDVDTAICPNCGSEVVVAAGGANPDTSEDEVGSDGTMGA